MTIAIPQPAASLVLVRQGPEGPEVLIQQRPESMKFGPGMLVFPGGKLALDDYSRIISRRFAPERTAAIRETFEETGVLFARRRTGAALSLTEAMRLARRYRERLDHGLLRFSRFLDDHDLVPDVDRLIDYAHWETPPSRSLRFDTRFFLKVSHRTVVLNQGSHESDRLFWERPQDILDREAGGKRLMFPTQMILQRMADFETPEAIAAAAADYESVCIGTDLFALGYDVAKSKIEAAGYDTSFFEIDGRLWG